MDRQSILNEIRRTAAENGGTPLGRLRLEKVAGIKASHWNKYWARFGDACKEAGFIPNETPEAYSEEFLVLSVIALCRELRRFPALSDLRVKRTYDATFPSSRTFDVRLGRKDDIIRKTLAYCHNRPELADIKAMCASLGEADKREPPKANSAMVQDGFVYLLKSGRFYKIGRTNHVGKRERDLAIQLPEETRTIHYIKTDDPPGIESYWHTRFSAKRKNGEWFDLSRDEVAAFKRRKFM